MSKQNADVSSKFTEERSSKMQIVQELETTKLSVKRLNDQIKQLLKEKDELHLNIKKKEKENMKLTQVSLIPAQASTTRRPATTKQSTNHLQVDVRRSLDSNDEFETSMNSQVSSDSRNEEYANEENNEHESETSEQLQSDSSSPSKSDAKRVSSIPRFTNSSSVINQISQVQKNRIISTVSQKTTLKPPIPRFSSKKDEASTEAPQLAVEEAKESDEQKQNLALKKSNLMATSKIPLPSNSANRAQDALFKHQERLNKKRENQV